MKLSGIFFMFVMFAAVTIGCSKSQIVPVSGTITVNGEPCANLLIKFQPVASGKNGETNGYGAVSKTDSNGHYEMEVISTDKEGKGAAVGMNRVRIELVGESAEAQILKKSSDPSKKTLKEFPWGGNRVQTTFDVPAGGTSEANFALPLKDNNAEENGI